MTRALFIAIGNPHRGDDGVAHEVAAKIAGSGDTRSVVQLTPEVAADIVPYDVVVFIDADVSAAEVDIQEVGSHKVEQSLARSSLTHTSTPAQIVELAKTLFGFSGRALICQIPVSELFFGTGLSRKATASAAQAVRKLGVELG